MYICIKCEQELRPVQPDSLLCMDCEHKRNLYFIEQSAQKTNKPQEESPEELPPNVEARIRDRLKARFLDRIQGKDKH